MKFKSHRYVKQPICVSLFLLLNEVHFKCNFALFDKISCANILLYLTKYLHKSTNLGKDAAFLHFCLKEGSENMIFP